MYQKSRFRSLCNFM